MSTIGNRIRDLSPAKRTLVLERLKQQKPVASGVIPRMVGDGESLPVSFAQQRLWLQHQLRPNSSFDNVPVVVRLLGSLQVDALAASLSKIVERHGILRTNYKTSADGHLIAVPAKRDPSGVLKTVEDVETVVAARETVVSHWVQSAASCPFDLANDSLIRARLLRLGTEEHVLVVTMHHIVSDGWSKNLLVQELAASYEALIHGQEPSLPELPIQYADFADWQTRQMKEPELQTEIDYWRQYLKDAPSSLDLPVDYPAGFAHTGAVSRRYHFRFPLFLKDELNRLALQHGVTLFMLLLSAFQVLLARYSGQEDVIVGTPVSGRSHLETNELIGVFLNAVAIRTDLRGQPTFLDVLQQVKTNVLRAHAHQTLPFEKVIELLEPQRDRNRAPVFQVVFILERPSKFARSIGGVSFEALNLDKHNAYSPYEWTLYMSDEADALTAALEYRTDLFAPETVERVSRHLGNLLEEIASDPERPLSHLALSNAAEREHLVKQCEGETTVDAKFQNLTELFSMQTARAPENLACRYKGVEWTYRDLDTRSNQLAHQLRKLGVEEGSIVGVAVSQSPEMVVGFLGALKAEAAYLALDLAQPKERLNFILADSQAQVIVTNSREWQDFSPAQALAGKTIVDLAGCEVATEPGTQLVSRATRESLAYLVYTSGSTGMPKAVMGTHAGAINRFQWMWRRYPFVTGEVACQKTTPSFVDSVWETWGPLLAGVPAVIVPAGEAADVRFLVKLLDREGVTRIVLVPSLLRALLETTNFDVHLRLLKLWIVSGEELPLELVEAFRKKVPGRTLLNLYGSSEVGADATWFDTAEQPESRDKTLIGRPIANISTYVLDPSMELTPPGVIGNLFVGGAGLSLGYWRQSALTAARFVPNPFAADGSRLYNTGDRARYLVDGSLEYWGRDDQQVKIRGHRVELDEVAAALRKHPHVESALVMASGSGRGETEMVAYLVPRAGASTDLSVTDLRQFLLGSLPEYMIPAQWAVSEKLQYLPNGKVDRAALKATARLMAEDEQLETEMLSPTEEAIASMWEEALQRGPVRRKQNFFEIGGHSLLAVRVIANIYKRFAMEVSLREFFENPTVEMLSGKIAQSIAEATDPHKPDERALREVSPERGPIALSFAQRRLFFLDQMFPGKPTYNVPVAVLLTGPLDAKLLERSLNLVVERHAILRTTFYEVDGNVVQSASPDFWLELKLTDLSSVPQEQRETMARHVVMEEGRKAFDLRARPAIRASLVRLSEKEHIAAITLHHIICDGESLEVLIQDLAAFYEAGIDGYPVRLPELPLQYFDFVRWQSDWLSADRAEKQLSYWRNALQSDGSEPDLPLDYPRPTVPSGEARRIYFDLPRELQHSLEGVARHFRTTPMVVLLAAFAAVLKLWTKRDKVSIGSPVDNRKRAEFQSLIGFFVNTVVLRTDVSGNIRFADLLLRTRETVLSAYAHQDVPFEMLLKDLPPSYGRAQRPLFHLWFVYLMVPAQRRRVAQLELAPYGVEYNMSRYDLKLNLLAGEEGLAGSFEYDTKLFAPHTIEQLRVRYQRVLERVSREPEVGIPDLTNWLEGLEVSELTERKKQLAQASLDKLMSKAQRSRW